MAITKRLGKPSLFIIFTANLKWPEILHNLEHRQTPDIRPNLIDIVFRHKFNALQCNPTQSHVFGKCIRVVFSAEYQNRGLPYAHILLILHNDDVPPCADHVD